MDLLKENHKEQMSTLKEIREDQTKQGKTQKEQLEDAKIFRKLSFEFQSNKRAEDIQTGTRNLIWVSYVGFITVGFSFILILPIITSIFFDFKDTFDPIKKIVSECYIFEDNFDSISSTVKMIQTLYISIVVFVTIAALKFYTYKINLYKRQSFSGLLAQVRKIETYYTDKIRV